MNLWRVGIDTPSSVSAANSFSRLIKHLRNSPEKPWCAWVDPSIRAGLFWAADGRGMSLEDCLETASTLFVEREKYENFSGATQNSLQLASLSILVNLQDEITEKGIQKRRKDLLDVGLMIGFLHPKSSLWTLQPDRAGYPYRSSDAFLTLRRPVIQDKIFVSKNKTLCEKLDKWLTQN